MGFHFVLGRICKLIVMECPCRHYLDERQSAQADFVLVARGFDRRDRVCRYALVASVLVSWSNAANKASPPTFKVSI